MAIEILMPALSPTMTEGKLAKWNVSVGDTVSSGDVIAEIETDKATMEVEAVDDGVVAKIYVQEGTENVPVNNLIALLAEEGEDIDSISVDTSSLQSSLNVETNDVSNSDIEINLDAPDVAFIAEEQDWNGEFKKITVRQALCEAMAEEMRKDERVFVMGEEVAEYEGAYKVTQGLLAEFGDKRVVDTPITEYGFAGLAVGASMKGLLPIVEFMTWNFGMQALDHILNSAAKTLYMSGGQLGAPIVFRGPNGAAARVGAQHSQCFASWFMHCPGLKVVAPYSASDAKGLLKSSIRDKNPVIFLENELLYGEEFDVPDTDDWTVPIGKAKIVKKGSDVTIVAFSIMVGKALKAAAILEQEGISAEVIDLRTIRPLDTETILESVKKTNRAVTVEEGWPSAGVGSELGMIVMEQAFDYLDAPVERVAGLDIPLPYAENLEKLALPDENHIVSAAKKVCYK